MKGILAWFAGNHVAAGLLSAMVVVGGLSTLLFSRLTVEIFPEFSIDLITVSVRWPGASPEEVERSILVKIEEQVHDLDGVKRLNATAREGIGAVSIQVRPGADARRLLDEVKAQVGAIDGFPEDAEPPLVEEVVVRNQVLDVAVHGSADEATLKRVGQQVRDEIARLPGITLVDLVGARDDEISIEVSEPALQRHGLTFDRVAEAVRRSSLDLPAGHLRTVAGDVLLRGPAQAYRGQEFAALPLLTRPDGGRVLLGDVATVRDGFAEVDRHALFDGEQGVLVQVFRVGEQNALDVAETVRGYVAGAAARMPAGVTLTIWNDTSVFLSGRIDLLVDNALQGFALVFLVLAVFLHLRLAFWVSIGIPVSFLGCLWLMPAMDMSINMVSLFSFILVLGIVVDDAIVIGEATFHHRSQGLDPLAASVKAVHEVALPVTVAVLTAIIAFMPMLNVAGMMGKIFRVIPLICIATLVMSLIETQLALPAHLANSGTRTWRLWGLARGWERVQQGANHLLFGFVRRVYRPFLASCLAWNWATLAAFAAAIVLTMGLVLGGRIRFTFFPPVEGDLVVVDLALPPGTSTEQTALALRRLETAALALRAELAREAGEEVVQHLLTSVGSQPFRMQADRAHASGYLGAELGEVIIALTPTEQRSVPTAEVERRWRAAIGEIPEAVELTYSSSVASLGQAIAVQLSGDDIDELALIADRLKAELRAIPGVVSPTDSHRAGQRELQLAMRPGGEALGLSHLDVARQVRQAFHGEEAQRMQRGREEVRVMVRYPEAARRSIGDLEGMRIRTAAGEAVPLAAVAEVRSGSGYTAINRAGRKRVIDVTAGIDPGVASANATEINGLLTDSVLPRLLAGHPGVGWSMEGEQREQAESMAGLGEGFALSVLLIYVIIAASFRSYLQPFLIMLAIPFGLVGAVLGHLVMGMDLSILSLCGMVALSGVVVNDSIVLIDAINRLRREGMPLALAIREAGALRFRPILLTSLTTFIGLVPVIISGQMSVQAQFLVPMAVALGFGGVFSTVISLVLVPTCYAMLEGWKEHWKERWRGA